MDKWKRKFRPWKKTQARSGEACEPHPKQHSTTPAANDSPDAKHSGEDSFGIKVLVPGENPLVDIVAVHGLDGHREKSWTADNGVLWLNALLPAEIGHARVLTYGYDSRTRSSKRLTCQTLYGHSMTLVSDLSLYRRTTKTERRPIIFLAHSLGGIVVKSALIHSNMKGVGDQEPLKAIKLSTHGVMFFGTPHQGTDSASWGKVFANIASLFQHTSTSLLEDLERDSRWLEMQLEQYNSISSDIFTIFCFESYPISLPAGKSMMVVPRASAVVPGMRNAEAVEIRKDHISLVKFQRGSDSDFQTVIGHLRMMCEGTGERVAQNWEHWEETKALTAETWLNDFSIPLRVEYDRNPNFTGRTKDLDHIRSFFEETQQHKRKRVPLVVHGTGGMGKTQLVREFIFSNSLGFTITVWIDARSLQSVHNSYVGFMQKLVDYYVGRSRTMPPPYLRVARHLGIVGLISEDGQLKADPSTLDRIVSACLAWLERDGNTDWLLIFDNVDDLEALQITSFFPKKQGSILVTSRRPECSRLGEGWKLGAMEVQDSIELLSKSFSREIKENSDDYEEATRIVEKLGGLPLAIDQAGSYLFMLQKPLRAFLPLFEENFNKTLSKKPPSAVWQYGEETAVTTWEISFEAIRTKDPQAARLLLLCSFFANNDIGVDFLRRGLPTQFSGETDVDEHLSTLFSFSLADRKREDSFSIHPIVHWWARERLGETQAEELATSALRAIARAIDSLKMHDLSVDRQIMQHMGVCDELCAKKVGWGKRYDMDEFREEWASFAGMYQYHGRNMEGVELMQRALAGYEKMLGPDHLRTLGVVQNLGLLYHGRGQTDEAEKMWKRALAGYKKALELDHPDTLLVVQNLGMLYQDRGQTVEAEKMLKQALEGYEKVQEPDHRGRLGVMSNLGKLYYERGQIVEAEKMWKRTLAGYKKVLEPDHPDTLMAMQNLGTLYHGRGQIVDAERMFKEAMKGYEKILEPDHPQALMVVQNLAMLYHGRGKIADAEKMLKQALEGYEKVQEPDHRDRLRVMNNLGLLYYGRGQTDEAEKMWKRALAGYKKVLEPDHPDTLMAMQNLAILYFNHGQTEKAEKMWDQTLASYEKFLERDHRDRLRVVYNLAMVYFSHGQTDKAEKMAHQVLTEYKKTLKPDHPDTLQVVHGLGMIYHRCGRIDEAEMVWKQALAGFEKSLKPDHPQTLMVVQNLGELYLGRGQMADAERMLNQALAGCKKVLEPGHPQTLMVVRNLGELYHARGQVDEAEKTWKQVLAGYEKALVLHHPDTSWVLFHLGSYYADVGRLEEAETMLKRALLGYQQHQKGHEKDLFDTHHVLARVFERRGYADEAEKSFSEAADGYDSIFGPHDPKTVDARRQLERIRGRRL